MSEQTDAAKTKPAYIAIVGNPNAGKTTLFNALTGLRYKVANYPGVTVEKKEGRLTLPSGNTTKIVDLPGSYALTPLSLDEEITYKALERGLLHGVAPALVVAVVDASNLERNLFFVSELIDAGHNILIALNMIDEADKKGIKILEQVLSRDLDLPVIPIVAREKRGLKDLNNAIQHSLLNPKPSSKKFAWLSKDKAKSTSNEIHAKASLRYTWIKELCFRATKTEQDKSNTWVSKLDSILTHKIFGPLILLLIFAFVFQSIFLWAEAPMTWIESLVSWISNSIKWLLPAGLLTSLLADGIVQGVGNVIIFVPQIAILFLFLGVLEECGYLSRAAFILDNFMRKVGLQGRSFIPLLSSFACAVPGILSTRTIPFKSDRLATIMVAPLMSCSARIPVYTVLIGAFIPATTVWGVFSLRGVILLGLYLLGIIGACAVAWFLKKFLLNKEPSYYMMEMPQLRRPILSSVVRNAYDHVFSFIKNASSIILACSIIVWFLATFPRSAPEVPASQRVENSYAGQLGKLIEPAIRPLGFDWKLGFAIISSFPAREVFVSSLATIYGLSSDSEEDSDALVTNLQARRDKGEITLLTGLSLLIFYVYACQCMSTLAICKRETGSWKWPIAMFVYMTALAYFASLVTYQVGRAL